LIDSFGWEGGEIMRKEREKRIWEEEEGMETAVSHNIENDYGKTAVEVSRCLHAQGGEGEETHFELRFEIKEKV
jgi:hypothetical protein